MDKTIPERDDNILDPRIQIELETLNNATDEINKLEIELDEANTTFRMLYNDSTRRLKVLIKKLGSCIEKARPYYQALEDVKKAQLECQKAAVQYQRANEFLTAAKEMVSLAEKRFENGELNFDGAWQDMLNHATSKVIHAEMERARLGREHCTKAQIFHSIELKAQQLEDSLRRPILKSRTYFEEKNLCQEQLNTQKERIESLKNQIRSTKQTYSESLKKLELISEEIHLKRKRRQSEFDDDSSLLPQGPREPGVGAEKNSPTEETKSFDIDLDANLNLPSLFSVEENRAVEGCSSQDVSSDLETSSNLVEKLDHMNLMNECVQIQKKEQKGQIDNHKL